jgi:predicted DNA-binding transcriptional regulator AlpA
MSSTTQRIGIAAVLPRLGCSRTTLERLLRRGEFPQPHYLGMKRLWFLGEVEAWEARRMAEHADPARRRGGAKNLKRRTAA